MKTLSITAALASFVLVAGCGAKTETSAVAPENATADAVAMSVDMSNMTMAAEDSAKAVHGTGTVTATDKAAGTITIDHGPIPAANWPAMTMAFTAKPALIDSVKRGDKISFDLSLKGGAGELTGIAKE